MIRVLLEGHRHTYPVSDVLRLFFGPPHGVGDQVLEIGEDGVEVLVTSALEPAESLQTGDTVRIRTSLCFPLKTQETPQERVAVVASDQQKREIKRQLYALLSEWTGIRFPWGSLTGIRPTVVAQECLETAGGDADRAARSLCEVYGVDEGKAALALTTTRLEETVQRKVPQEAVCLYVSIPFCPSRCDYCSFTLPGNQADPDLLARYVDAVVAEAEIVLSQVDRSVSCVYVGGGTSTVLTAALLDRLLTGLKKHMRPLPDAEWTVEAGRPDSIDMEKLGVLHSHGIDRVCVNPQSLHDKTLSRIGRLHSAAQTRHAVEQVKASGFPILNMDLIAGLPGENYGDFVDSIQGVMAMGPENITIHTLSMKRNSALSGLMRDNGHDAVGIGQLRRPDPEVANMVDSAHKMLHEGLWRPYYLYRQKDVVGGLENTGYARSGTECRYNVAMMGDRRSVIGLGCGAISKIASGNSLKRIPTVRNPALYMEKTVLYADRIIRAFGNRV